MDLPIFLDAGPLRLRLCRSSRMMTSMKIRLSCTIVLELIILWRLLEVLLVLHLRLRVLDTLSDKAR